MTTQEIVSKLWNLCNVLRDDGITYQNYLNELTYILFLKMAEETKNTEQTEEVTAIDGKNLLKKTELNLKIFIKNFWTILEQKQMVVF